ncbi:hypothetical protein LMG667_02580 [Xanthomonas euvesicatoria]|nr:hypothetical protein LMG667_02580 [Xanthomonas euvesicatoria]
MHLGKLGADFPTIHALDCISTPQQRFVDLTCKVFRAIGGINAGAVCTDCVEQRRKPLLAQLWGIDDAPRFVWHLAKNEVQMKRHMA